MPSGSASRTSRPSSTFGRRPTPSPGHFARARKYRPYGTGPAPWFRQAARASARDDGAAGRRGPGAAMMCGSRTLVRGGIMLRTRLCELFDIEAPVVQAAIWPATTPELVAAVSEGGGLGSVAAVFGSAAHVRGQIERV